MKKLITAALLALAIVSPALAVNPFLAADRGLPIKRANIPCAQANMDGFHFVVTDCASKTNCASGGTAAASIVCDGGAISYVGVTSTELSGYVATTGNQTIGGSKTFSSEIVAAGGLQSSSTSTDPALTFASGAFTLRGATTNTNYGRIINDDSNRMTLSFGPLFSATDFSIGTTGLDLQIGGSGVWGISAWTVVNYVPVQIPAATSLPTCDGLLGSPEFPAAMFDSSSGFELCVCNGTSWAAADGSGTCS